MNITQRLPLALLFLRLGVFLVMLMWTLDKLIKPDHASNVFKKYYGVGIDTGVFYIVGIVELLLVLAFVAGFAKRWTYGIVLVLHGVSTLAAFGNYLDPWSHLTFFAAWPVLAACFALYYLRDADTLMALDKGGVASTRASLATN